MSSHSITPNISTTTKIHGAITFTFSTLHNSALLQIDSQSDKFAEWVGDCFERYSSPIRNSILCVRGIFLSIDKKINPTYHPNDVKRVTEEITIVATAFLSENASKPPDEKTERGSIIYGQFKDTENSKITISESSDSAGPEKICIDCKGNMADGSYSPKLDAKQAQLLMDCLKSFIHHCNSSDSGKA